MKSLMAIVAGLAALMSVLGSARAAAPIFDGKLWLLSSVGLQAGFPVPPATPDATFMTRHISFVTEARSPFNGPYNGRIVPEINNAVTPFLNGSNRVVGLAFSGLNNAVVGGVVTGTTPIEPNSPTKCGPYGLLMELTGTLSLKHDEVIFITHDDGIALKIDGVDVPGVYSGPTEARVDFVQFEGPTGSHTIDLVYVNSCGAGLLSFSAAM